MNAISKQMDLFGELPKQKKIKAAGGALAVGGEQGDPHNGPGHGTAAQEIVFRTAPFGFGNPVNYNSNQIDRDHNEVQGSQSAHKF